MNNAGIYDAVVAGVGGSLQAAPGATAPFADRADILATAVDSLVPVISGGASASQISLMSEVVSGLIANRFLGDFGNGSSPNYTGMAIEIARLYTGLATSLNNAPLPGGGAVVPLHNVLFVDKNTAVLPASQDGSIAAPFSTITAALSTDLAAAFTLFICPGDYSDEISIPVRTGLATSLVSFDFRMPALYVLNPATLPPQVILSGVEFLGDDLKSQLSLVGITVQLIAADAGITGTIQLSNSYVYNCETPGMEVFGDRSYFDNGGIRCAGFNSTSCAFMGSQTIVCTTIRGNVYLHHCVAGTTAVSFPAVDNGIVHVDPWSYNTVSGMTNGVIEVEGLPLQYITGSTTDEAVNSIISAGETLHFWIDQRVT